MSKTTREPWRFSLPFFPDEEIGLGDALKRVTSSMGIKPCGRCQQRAEFLNRMLVFQGKKRPTNHTPYYPDET